MRVYAPDYYNKFKCIAEKCRHNCCIGWEIDIDAETYDLYMNEAGTLGDRLRSSISCDGGSPHFVLAEGERCPFLNGNNLCDIIAEKGEAMLCEICNTHPRYRNFFQGREEMGLGLCCEEATELILSNPNKTRLAVICDGEEYTDDEEQQFFGLRDRIIGILQDRALSIDDRIEGLFENFGIDIDSLSFRQWIDTYLSLERLDEEWTRLLQNAKAEDFGKCDSSDEAFAIACEQLLVYFILRHTGEGIFDGKLYERIAFAVLSFRIISAVCAGIEEQDRIRKLKDVAGRYSLEIEYSDENIGKLLEAL